MGESSDAGRWPKLQAARLPSEGSPGELNPRDAWAVNRRVTGRAESGVEPRSPRLDPHRLTYTTIDRPRLHAGAAATQERNEPEERDGAESAGGTAATAGPGRGRGRGGGRSRAACRGPVADTRA